MSFFGNKGGSNNSGSGGGTGGAPLEHQHYITDIHNLQDRLNEINTAITTHSHTLTVDEITGLQNELNGINNLIQELGTRVDGLTSVDFGAQITVLSERIDTLNQSLATHKHIVADVTGLQDALNKLATKDSLNTLATKTEFTSLSQEVDVIEAKVTDIETDVVTVSGDLATLSGNVDGIAVDVQNLKANANTGGGVPLDHTHKIDDVVNLQATLDGKASQEAVNILTGDIALVEGDLTALSNETMKQADLDALKNDILATPVKAHTHTVTQVEGLQTELDNKAPLVHTHQWSTLEGKPNSTVSQIDEAVTKAHTHDNQNVLGGLEDNSGVLLYNGVALGEASFLAVQDIAERDAIPLDIRKIGLTVLTTDDNSMYYLKGGIDNAFWSIFSVGAGGATTASTLPAIPSTGLTGTNVQTLIDELAQAKANQTDVYTKAETENFVKTLPIDYLTLENLPDLSLLHKHDNQSTLDMFGQYQGNLTWDNKTLGDLVTEIYDADKDGVIDVASTLNGLLATVTDLNTLTGITGNVQAQINALSSGVTFKGEYDTYDAMSLVLTVPSKGDLVYIKTDETKAGALDTQYVYDGTNWIYGGGTTKIPDATLTTKGVMQLGGDLAHPFSTASSPKLTPTGVTAGLYKSANLTIGEDGRVTHAEEGSIVFLNDTVISDVEGWSSQKIDLELSKHALRNHTHAQLHDANMLGKIALVDGETPSNSFVPTYDAVLGKAIWKEQQGGKVFVGSKFVQGDYTLKAGSYVSLLIDDVTKEITISSTYRENGGNIIPTGVEVVHSVEVPASGKVRFSVESGYNKVMLHTLQMQNDKNMNGEIRLYNQSADGFVEYNSNPEMTISDIINIPIFDNDNSKMLHFEIDNLGIETATFTLRAKITNLL